VLRDHYFSAILKIAVENLPEGAFEFEALISEKEIELWEKEYMDMPRQNALKEV